MLQNSEYPDILKISKVIPIPNESGANVEEIYRPISLLSIKLLTYLEDTVPVWF